MVELRSQKLAIRLAGFNTILTFVERPETPVSQKETTWRTKHS